MDGGCLCGRVRYTISGEPAFVSVCHCTHCQRQTGTSFALLVAAPRSAVEISGETRTFADRGETGRSVDRVFCPACGSPIVANPEVRPEVSFVFAGTLSDPVQVRPVAQIFCDSAQPWLELKGLEKFSRMPPL